LVTVLAQAADLADEQGLDALSMASLASRLGVRTPALYHYVSSLAGLRRALGLRGLEIVSVQVGREVVGKAGDDAVRALAYVLRTFANEHPGLYEAASRAPDAADNEWRQVGQEVVALLVRALDAYRLSDDEARQVVRMLRSIVHGCVGLERSGGFGLPGDVERTFEALVVALLEYLHHHYRPPQSAATGRP
jgi:AcrR family transcriptional regulator